MRASVLITPAFKPPRMEVLRMPTDPSYLELRCEEESSRFWAKVRKDPDGCWIWTSAVIKNGYGVFMLRKQTVYAHRISFFAAHQGISLDLVVDHMCRNRLCVNPDHLRQLTRGENVRIGMPHNRAKTHCRFGHLLGVPIKGRRICKICHNEVNRRYRESHKINIIRLR